MYSWGYPTFWQTTQQYLITRELGFWEGEKESKEKGGMRGVGDRYLSAEVSRWRNDHGILDGWTTAMSHAYICRDDETIPRLVRRNGRQNAWEVYTAWEEMKHQVHTRGIQCKQQAKAYLPSEKYTEELAPAVSLILFLLLLRLFLPSMTWHYASLILFTRIFFYIKDNIVYASCSAGGGEDHWTKTDKSLQSPTRPGLTMLILGDAYLLPKPRVRKQFSFLSLALVCSDWQ